MGDIELNTVIHDLTGKQILDFLLNRFYDDQDTAVWLIVQKHDVDNVKRKLRVALSKERQRLDKLADKNSGHRMAAKLARCFTLSMSLETAVMTRDLVAFAVTYDVTRSQELKRAAAAIQSVVRKRLQDARKM